MELFENTFINRENELKILHNVYENAQKGKGTTILISGEARIGKTHLIDEFKKRFLNQENTLFLYGQCIFKEESQAFAPFVQALKNYFKISKFDSQKKVKIIIGKSLGEISENIISLIPIVGSFIAIGVKFFQSIQKIKKEEKAALSDLNMKKGKDKLFFSIQKFLKKISKKSTTILVIDDLHFADEDSLNLFNFLSRDLNFKIVIIGLYRSSINKENKENKELIKNIKLLNKAKEENSIKEIILNPFSKDESISIMKSLLKGNIKIEEEFIERILGRSNGNPYFLKEIVKSLQKEGIIHKKNDIWVLKTEQTQINVPLSLTEIIEKQLKDLDKQKFKELQLASIIGKEFNYEMLCKLTYSEIEELEDNLEVLVEKNIIREKIDHIGWFEFVHVMIKDVVYNKVLAVKKRRLHKKIAKSIEDLYSKNLDDYTEILAYHYKKGMIPGKAIFYLIKSGEKAEQIYAFNKAIKNYKSALNFLLEEEQTEENLRKMIDLNEHLGLLYSVTVDEENAVKYYKNQIKIANKINNIKAKIRAYSGIANIYFIKGKYPESVVNAEKGIKLLKEYEDPILKGKLLYNLGLIAWRESRWNEAIELYNESAALSREGLDYEQEALTLLKKGVIFRNLGNYDKALKSYLNAKVALEEGESNDQLIFASLYNNMGTLYRSLAYWKDLECPLKFTDNPLEIKIGNQLIRTKSAWESGIRLYEKSLEYSEKVGYIREIGNTSNNISIIYATKKNPNSELAKKYCSKAREVLKPSEAKIDLIDNDRIFGIIYKNKKDWKQSEQFFNRSIKVARQIGSPNKEAHGLAAYGIMLYLKDEKENGIEKIDIAIEIYNKIGAEIQLKAISMVKRKLIKGETNQNLNEYS